MTFQQIALLIALSGVVAACNNPSKGKPEARIGATAVPAAATPAPTPDPNAKPVFLKPENTKLQFFGASPAKTHPGTFEKFEGRIDAVGDDPTTATVRFTIQMASVKTDEPKLDVHLRSADFFDVAKHPTAVFTSTRISQPTDRPQDYTIHGNLQLRGVTRPISFPAMMRVESNKVLMRAEFGLKRADFGIVYPGMPDNLIREYVLIRINIDAAR